MSRDHKASLIIGAMVKFQSAHHRGSGNGHGDPIALPAERIELYIEIAVLLDLHKSFVCRRL